MSNYTLSRSNKIYLWCVVGVYGLVFFWSLNSSSQGWIIGRAMGVLFFPFLVSWGVWRLSGKSKGGASIAFNIVLTLGVLSQLFAVGKQALSITNRQVVLDKKEAYYLSLSQSDSLAESRETYIAYKEALRSYLSSVADTQSGADRESVEILAEMLIELNNQERSWLKAYVDIRSPRILDISQFNNSNEFGYQKTKLGNYIWQSKHYREVASVFMPALRRRLSEKNNDKELQTVIGVEWVQGLESRLDSLNTGLQPHVEFGNTMMSIVKLLEQNVGHWEIQNDEILMSSDYTLSEYDDLVVRLDSLAREIDTMTF